MCVISYCMFMICVLDYELNSTEKWSRFVFCDFE